MTLEQLAIGVTSGVVATALISLILFLIRTVWQRHVEPWWENKLYEDARIDGEWSSTLHAEATAEDEEQINVRQTGHKVEGDIKCIAGPDKGRSYTFVGCIKNQILSGYYWNIDRTSIDSGSFSLRLEQDGSLLRGHTVYYNDTKHELISRQYTWTRMKVPGGESSIESPTAQTNAA